jgi:signal transduction histidine kinase
MNESSGNRSKTAAITRFAATICHEFGNPIIGLKYLLDDFAKRENLSDDEQKLIRLGQEEIDRVRSLVVRLGAVYRPLVAPRQDCDLHELIETTLAGVEAVCAGQGIRLVRRLSRQRLVAPVVAEKIGFVLGQLVENAIEAMADSGVLTISSAVKDGHILIAVSDTGRGLPSSCEERLFEPFFSSKQNVGGSARGFGLAVSYHIMAEHQGNLRFQRNKKRGCVFTMTLPQ